MTELIGIVEDQLFTPLSPKINHSFALSTASSIVAGQNLDDIDMKQYEGKALLVWGEPDENNGYIFRTRIIDDKPTPLLTALVKYLMNQN